MTRAPSPYVAVDIVIEALDEHRRKGIVLIERGHPPYVGCWALPGGFVEIGESCETAAVREAKEETGLDVTLLAQLPVFSDPHRDPRAHVMSVGYIAKATGIPEGGDDAVRAAVFALDELPQLAFDHEQRIEQYIHWRRGRTWR